VFDRHLDDYPSGSIAHRTAADYTPLFALDAEGVKLYAAPYARWGEGAGEFAAWQLRGSDFSEWSLRGAEFEPAAAEF
jgi:hypothetical protein